MKTKENKIIDNCSLRKRHLFELILSLEKLELSYIQMKKSLSAVRRNLPFDWDAIRDAEDLPEPYDMHHLFDCSKSCRTLCKRDLYSKICRNLFDSLFRSVRYEDDPLDKELDYRCKDVPKEIRELYTLLASGDIE